MTARLLLLRITSSMGLVQRILSRMGIIWAMGLVQGFLSRMGNIWAKGRVQEDGCVYCPQLGDLSQDVVAVILSLTTPKDIARLACVSRLYRAASRADSVWQKMLPPRYADVLAQAPEGALASTSSKKQVFDFLVNGVLLEHGTQVLFKSS